MANAETIRYATRDDAGRLAALAEKTFRDAFAAENRAADMDAHCARSFGAELQRAEIEDAGLVTLLVESGGELVAYAQLAPGAPSRWIEGGTPAEIRRFYVDAAWHGRGIAQRLMERTLEIAGAAGVEVVWLGVWERNPRAIAFYGKSGFTQRGHQTFLLGADPQRDLVLARRISGGSEAR